MKLEAYYLGCGNRAGHYFWEPGESPRSASFFWPVEWPFPWDDPDGGLAPQNDRKEGRAVLHHKDGWTALSFWDYSVDRRGGSNSTFFFHAPLDFEIALREAKRHFPWVFTRLSFGVMNYATLEETDLVP